MSSLPAGLLVSVLLRRVNDAGGMAMMRARGHAQAGAILLIDLDGEGGPRALERGIGFDGQTTLVEPLPPGSDVESYWQRRRRNDPDLWVIELSIPVSERSAVLTMLED